ncbi:MAG: hypothetical protein Roseis2KO_58100 [Roseivirga sp.]
MQNEVSVKKPVKSQLVSEKQLLAISLAIATYFLTIFLLNFFEVDFTLIGVFRELLTVPMLLGQLIFLVMGLAILVRRKESKRKYLTVMSILLLATSSLLTIGSFF